MLQQIHTHCIIIRPDWRRCLQFSKTSPWSDLLGERARGGGTTWAANWRTNSAQDQVSTPSWFSSEYKGAIEFCSHWKLCHFPLSYGHLLFPLSSADGSPTYWMSNGHTMDFLPKVILAWSLNLETQFSEYHKKNFHAFTLQEINKFYTVTYIQMKQQCWVLWGLKK